MPDCRKERTNNRLVSSVLNLLRTPSSSRKAEFAWIELGALTNVPASVDAGDDAGHSGFKPPLRCNIGRRDIAVGAAEVIIIHNHFKRADGVPHHLSIGVGDRIDDIEDSERLPAIRIEIKAIFDMVNPQSPEGVGTELIERLADPAEAGGSQSNRGRIGIVDSQRDDLINRTLRLARVWEGGATLIIRTTRGASPEPVID